MPNILELKKLEQGIGYELIEENVKVRPELTIIDADTLAGTEMSLSVRTDLPSVAFTRPNEGVGTSKSRFVNRIFQCANLDAIIKCDLRVLKKFGSNSPAAGRWMSAEQSGFVESAMRLACRQFYYGINQDAKGFPGLIAQSATDADHVLDATGSEDKKTSIWLIAAGPNKLQWLFGEDRTLVFDEWFKQTIAAEDDSTKQIEAMISWMHWAPGMRLANKNAAFRIKNITTQANKTATFAQMFAAIEIMRDELGMEPTHILMSNRSREQLRLSLVTDLLPNPPLPTEFEGVPIVHTSSISNTEQI